MRVEIIPAHKALEYFKDKRFHTLESILEDFREISNPHNIEEYNPNILLSQTD